MKKLTITLIALFVLVSGVGFAAGTTKRNTGAGTTDRTHVVAFVNPTQTAVASGVITLILFNNELVDAQNDFSTVTGSFTCRISGWYRITVKLVLLDTDSTAGTEKLLLLYKNVSTLMDYAPFRSISDGLETITVSGRYLLAEGDTVHVALRAGEDGVETVGDAAGAYTRLEIVADF